MKLPSRDPGLRYGGGIESSYERFIFGMRKNAGFLKNFLGKVSLIAVNLTNFVMSGSDKKKEPSCG